MKATLKHRPTSKEAEIKFKVLDHRIKIFRNKKLEVILYSPDPLKTSKYLAGLVPDDYQEYLRTYDLPPTAPLMGWLFDLLKVDPDAREILKYVRVLYA